MTERITVRFEPDQLVQLRELALQLEVSDSETGAYRSATPSDVVRMAVEEFIVTRRTEPLFSDPIGVGSCE